MDHARTRHKLPSLQSACHIYPFLADLCRGEQSGLDVERDKGRGKKRAIMSLSGPKNYSAEDLDATVRAYAASANIVRVSNEYPSEKLRHQASLLKNGLALE